MDVIYSAIFGEYDTPSQAPESDYPCVMISESERTLDIAKRQGWHPIQVADTDALGSRKLSRSLKLDLANLDRILLDHIGYVPDRSIWLDGSLASKKPIDPLFGLVSDDAPLAISRHAFCRSLADEVVAVLNSQRDKAEIVIPQVERYWRDAFAQTSHYESTFLVRYHSLACRRFCSDWWNEVNCYSVRDQISLPWALWRHQLQVCEMAGTVYDNEFFCVRRHNGEPQA